LLASSVTPSVPEKRVETNPMFRFILGLDLPGKFELNRLLFRRLGLRDNDHVIVRTETVVTRPMICGVIFPLTIDPEPIFVSPGIQHGNLFPHAVGVPFHGVNFRVPSVEISHQNDLAGTGGVQGKNDLAPASFLA
jgi:hypothetical protein